MVRMTHIDHCDTVHDHQAAAPATSETTTDATEMSLIYADLLARTQAADGAVLSTIGRESYQTYERGQITWDQLGDLQEAWMARLRQLGAMNVPEINPLAGVMLDALQRGGFAIEPGFGPDGTLAEISLVGRTM